MGAAVEFAGDLLGAGEGLGFSKLLMAPLLGSLMTIPALFRTGILKSDFGAGLFEVRLADGWWLAAGVIGVCEGPTLEGGRSETPEGVLDIG